MLVQVQVQVQVLLVVWVQCRGAGAALKHGNRHQTPQAKWAAQVHRCPNPWQAARLQQTMSKQNVEHRQDRQIRTQPPQPRTLTATTA
jgi:hypothetical protein